VMLSELDLCGRSVLSPLTELDNKQAHIIVKEMHELINEIKRVPLGAEITWS
jgi:hypothetical protein